MCRQRIGISLAESQKSQNNINASLVSDNLLVFPQLAYLFICCTIIQKTYLITFKSSYQQLLHLETCPVYLIKTPTDPLFTEQWEMLLIICCHTQPCMQPKQRNTHSQQTPWGEPQAQIKEANLSSNYLLERADFTRNLYFIMLYSHLPECTVSVFIIHNLGIRKRLTKTTADQKQLVI